MAIKMTSNYSKKLGLPGFSSHQFSVSLETELATTDDVHGETQRLYQLLQANVDEQIKTVGFVPPYDYGMEPAAANGSPAPNASANASANIPNNASALAAAIAAAIASINNQPSPVPNGNNGNNANGSNWQRGPAWKCSDKQREFILKLVDEHKLDKHAVEALAVERFGHGVCLLNKIEASGLIEEMLETHGGNAGQGKAKRSNGSAYNNGRRTAA